MPRARRQYKGARKLRVSGTEPSVGMIVRRVVTLALTALLLSSVRIALHVGGYRESTRLLALERTHPWIAHAIGVRSFSDLTEEAPSPLRTIVILWVRGITLVFALCALLAALVFAAATADPEIGT